MRYRNFVFIVTVVVFGMLLFFAMQANPSKILAQGSTPNATMAATEQDVTTLCEALRTVKKPAATAARTGTPGAGSDIARPSNAGGPGAALKLVGDLKAGQKVYTDSCQKCHGDQGQGGIVNPGSNDEKFPALNPIDDTLVDVDPAVYACNIDVFIEHGSVPSGPSPKETMQPWGDNKVLTSQQIADVISYVISLNGGPVATAVPTAAK